MNDDWLSQYTEATEQYIRARQKVEDQMFFRRAALRMMRDDGMSVPRIAELVGLKPGTVGGMIAKADRDLAEMLREDEEIQAEDA